MVARRILVTSLELHMSPYKLCHHRIGVPLSYEIRLPIRILLLILWMQHSLPIYLVYLLLNNLLGTLELGS